MSPKYERHFCTIVRFFYTFVFQAFRFTYPLPKRPVRGRFSRKRLVFQARGSSYIRRNAFHVFLSPASSGVRESPVSRRILLPS